MKRSRITFSIILFSALIVSFNQKHRTVQTFNHFTSSYDTIVLSTQKIKGYDLFPVLAGRIHFIDTTNRYYYPVVFPKNITDIKFSYQIIDFKPLEFINLKKNKSDLIKFLRDY